MTKLTKAEMLLRLRYIADAARKHEGVAAKARLQAGVDCEPVTTTVAPADGDDVSRLVDMTDIDGYLTAPKWVKHCCHEGSIVTLYFETRGSDGEYDLDTVAVGWIGTLDAAPMLLQVDGQLVMRTLSAPAKPERPEPRTQPAGPIDLAPAAMTRADLISEFNELLDEFGLRERGWTAHVNDRMTRTYGICRFRPRRVEISWKIASLNNREHNLDTIRHEVAHAIAGPGAGHGPKWKAACAQTGARPVRCYTSDEVAVPSGRYVATCEACGEICGTRNRAPRPTSYWHMPKHCSASVPGVKSKITWTESKG